MHKNIALRTDFATICLNNLVNVQLESLNLAIRTNYVLRFDIA